MSEEEKLWEKERGRQREESWEKIKGNQIDGGLRGRKGCLISKERMGRE